MWRRGAPGGLRCAGGRAAAGGAFSGCIERPERAEGPPSSPPKVESSASNTEAPAAAGAAAQAGAAGAAAARAVQRQSGAGEAAA